MLPIALYVNICECLCSRNMNPNPLDPCVNCGQVRCMDKKFDIEFPYELEVLTVYDYTCVVVAIYIVAFTCVLSI